jgi:SOS response regulatory protein OraA/RecX
MLNEGTKAECEKVINSLIRNGWTQQQIEYFLKELDKAATKHGFRAVIESLERLG